MRLKGKAAIVTGGSSGMGEATARLFAAEGARVTIVGRSDAGDAIVADIRAAGGEAIYCRADVSQPDEVRGFIDAHMQAFGQLDILFNNAAYEGKMTLIADTPDDEFDRIVNTNFKGIFVACKSAIPIMTKAGSGSIINVTAASSREGLAWANLGVYIGSKGGVVAFTRALAVEMAGTGVRVNSLSPGLIDTPMLQGSVERAPDPAAVNRTFAEIELLRRVGRPEEIATAALFLASEDSSYITGVDLLVDGGLVLGNGQGSN